MKNFYVYEPEKGCWGLDRKQTIEFICKKFERYFGVSLSKSKVVGRMIVTLTPHSCEGLTDYYVSIEFFVSRSNGLVPVRYVYDDREYPLFDRKY